MKDTWFKLPEDKRDRIIQAAFIAFARTGYEKTSLDAIVKAAGISKGGLYEYIDAKEDLFRFVLEEAYRRLGSRIKERTGEMPADPLERTVHIAEIAVDFYMEQAACIAFIVRSSRLEQELMQEDAQSVFDRYFLDLYGDADYSQIICGRDRLLLLLKWLLVKTRNDFLDSRVSGVEATECRRRYLEEWGFFLSVLKTGVYVQKK